MKEFKKKIKNIYKRKGNKILKKIEFIFKNTFELYKII